MTEVRACLGRQARQETCYVGSLTDDPCGRPAAARDEHGVWVCEGHASQPLEDEHTHWLVVLDILEELESVHAPHGYGLALSEALEVAHAFAKARLEDTTHVLELLERRYGIRTIRER